MTDEKKILLSQSEMAAWLGITPQALRKHRDVWVLDGDRFDARATSALYCASLREAIEARGGEAHVISLSAERARLAKERADELGIKNEALRDGLVSAVEAGATWARFLRDLTARFLALPDRAHAAAGLTAAQTMMVDREMRTALGAVDADQGRAGGQ